MNMLLSDWQQERRQVGIENNIRGHFYEDKIINELIKSGYTVVRSECAWNPGYDCLIYFDNDFIKLEIKTMNQGFDKLRYKRKLGKKDRKNNIRGFKEYKYTAKNGVNEFDYLLCYNIKRKQYYLFGYTDIVYKKSVKLKEENLVTDLKTMFD